MFLGRKIIDDDYDDDLENGKRVTSEALFRLPEAKTRKCLTQDQCTSYGKSLTYARRTSSALKTRHVRHVRRLQRIVRTKTGWWMMGVYLFYWWRSMGANNNNNNSRVRCCYIIIILLYDWVNGITQWAPNGWTASPNIFYLLRFLATHVTPFIAGCRTWSAASKVPSHTDLTTGLLFWSHYKITSARLSSILLHCRQHLQLAYPNTSSIWADISLDLNLQ